MPRSPFAGPFEITYLPTAGLPQTTQIYNMEVLNENANPGQQGTQIDALGHFGHMDEAWDGASASFAEGARYYGGFTQKDVKPTPDSPLLKLGMEKVPPIVTTAVLLDAKTHVGGGKPMNAGKMVTTEHIEAMLKAQGLGERGILPGDVVFVYTGWSDHYRDPDTKKVLLLDGPRPLARSSEVSRRTACCRRWIGYPVHGSRCRRTAHRGRWPTSRNTGRNAIRRPPLLSNSSWYPRP